MKIKTLSINNLKFRINDGGAVRYDEGQDLPEAEKERARKNIGAAKEGNGGGYLLTEVVDNILVVTLTGRLTASIENGVLVVA